MRRVGTRTYLGLATGTTGLRLVREEAPPVPQFWWGCWGARAVPNLGHRGRRALPPVTRPPVGAAPPGPGRAGRPPSAFRHAGGPLPRLPAPPVAIRSRRPSRAPRPAPEVRNWPRRTRRVPRPAPAPAAIRRAAPPLPVPARGPDNAARPAAGRGRGRRRRPPPRPVGKVRRGIRSRPERPPSAMPDVWCRPRAPAPPRIGGPARPPPAPAAGAGRQLLQSPVPALERTDTPRRAGGPSGAGAPAARGDGSTAPRRAGRALATIPPLGRRAARPGLWRSPPCPSP